MESPSASYASDQASANDAQQDRARTSNLLVVGSHTRQLEVTLGEALVAGIRLQVLVTESHDSPNAWTILGVPLDVKKNISKIGQKVLGSSRQFESGCLSLQLLCSQKVVIDKSTRALSSYQGIGRLVLLAGSVVD